LDQYKVHAVHMSAGQKLVKITDIKVGKRHRRDLGDIDSLARSIADVGLLHPPVIRPDNVLITGARRLEACKRLGWQLIPVTVVDLDEIARGELAENSERKDFLPSEIVAIKRALEQKLKAEAKGRMSTGGKGGEIPQPSKGRAADKIGVFVGKDRKTVEKMEAVVAAAEADPERCGKLREDMDRTGRVSGPYKRLKIIQQDEAIRSEPPPLPGHGPYRVIVADPPWPYELRKTDLSNRGKLPYPEMPIEQICAMAVASLAHDDCTLWLWTTNYHMRGAFRVLDAWGFQHKTILTWNKDKMGTGDWLRGQTEHCLMAVRGRPVVTLTNQTTSQHWPVRAHSQKPVEFYDFVESLCPAPRYADIFSRYQHNDKWDCHGDEAAVELETTKEVLAGA
jgi:N6-adenosine-specific RNA methylase IME4